MRREKKICICGTLNWIDMSIGGDHWVCSVCDKGNTISDEEMERCVEMARNECDDCGNHIVECSCGETPCNEKEVVHPTRLRDKCDEAVALLQCLLLIDFKEGACYHKRPYEVLILKVVEMIEEIENGIHKMR